MSGIGACPCDGSQFGQGTVWLFPHSLLNLFTSISSRQARFWVEIFLAQLVSLTPHCGSCLAAGCVHFKDHISLPLISAKINPIDSLVPSNLSSLAHAKDIPHFHLQLLQISINCTGPLVLFCLLPHLFLFSLLFPFPFLICSLIQFSLFHLTPMTVLFPFWVRFNHAHLGLPSCFASFVLWRAVWISCTLRSLFTCKWVHTRLSFCVRVISVRMMLSSCIHFPGKFMMSLFWTCLAEWYSHLKMKHLFCIHISVEGTSGLFQVSSCYK